MKSVPFYANTEDNTHCYQAALRMVLKYFLPEQDFSWEKLEQMSAKVPGKSTWPQAMLIKLHEMNFDVVMTEAFDAVAFIEEGADYLIREFGEETASWQIANSDIEQEQKYYRQFLEIPGVCEQHIPVLNEIEAYLHKGYLVVCTVNSRALNGKAGYVGHAVVVYKVTAETVQFHDPGLPPIEGRVVSRDDFEAAWANPNEKAKEFKAIKLREAVHV